MQGDSLLQPSNKVQVAGTRQPAACLSEHSHNHPTNFTGCNFLPLEGGPGSGWCELHFKRYACQGSCYIAVLLSDKRIFQPYSYRLMTVDSAASCEPQP